MYEKDENSYCVTDLISKFSKNFPLLAVVTQGFLGETERDTFATGQVLRLHSVRKTRSIIAKITDDHKNHFCHISNISLPLSPDHNIQVITSKGKVKTIEEIARKGILPCKVKFAGKYDLKHREDVSLRLDQNLSILLEKEREMRSILGNPITGVKLRNRVLVIPEYLEDLRLAVITGVSGFDAKHWQEFQMYMSHIVDTYICFDKHTLSEGIIANTERGSDNVSKYEFLQWEPVKESEKGKTYTMLHGNSEEEMYAIIPDNLYEELSSQSKEWKEVLTTSDSSKNVTKQHLAGKTSGQTFEKPPALPKRNTDERKQTPDIPPKPDKHKKPLLQKPEKDKDNLEAETTVEKDDFKIEELTIADVGNILQRLHLTDYVDKFADALVDGVILKELDSNVFREFGLKRVESIRLLKFIQCGHIPK